MIHKTSADFWEFYRKLPADIQVRADKQFALLKANPQHSSLHFKKIRMRKGQEFWSARVTHDYRALAIKFPDAFLWVWIGDHSVYDVLIR